MQRHHNVRGSEKEQQNWRRMKSYKLKSNAITCYTAEH